MGTKYEYQFLRRTFAFLLDLLILQNFILVPLNWIIKNNMPEKISYIELKNFLLQNPELAKLLIIIWIFMCFISIIYFSTFEFLLSSTPGKRIFNLQVISENKTTEYWQYLIRNVWIFTFFPLWILEVVWYIVTKRRFTEKYTKTYVKRV